MNYIMWEFDNTVMVLTSWKQGIYRLGTAYLMHPEKVPLTASLLHLLHPVYTSVCVCVCVCVCGKKCLIFSLRHTQATY